MSAPLFLAGDIGGTKTHLATFLRSDERLKIVKSQKFSSTTYPSLKAMLREFLGTNDEPPLAACFGVPGVVTQGRAKPTNLTWGVDSEEVALEFHIPHVSLLNDLAANALGIAELGPKDFDIVQEGTPGAIGNRCVVSPGTGLGQAGLFWDGKRHQVWACEGGHTDFAPRNALEMALLDYLIKIYGHVSGERVVSGIGIENIYNFLRDTGRGKEIPAVAKEMESRDPNVIISQHADAATCPLCVQTLEIFISCFGAEAGNMALKSMALGGVYLGGGVSAKLAHHIKSAAFIHAFNDKGRLASVMEKIPVQIIMNDQAALLGAANRAYQSVHEAKITSP